MNDDVKIVICPKCGAGRPDGIVGCSSCGEGGHLDPTLCSNCGSKKPAGASVCWNCGLTLRPVQRSNSSVTLWALLLAFFGIPGCCLGTCFLTYGGEPSSPIGVVLFLIGLGAFIATLTMLVRSYRK